MNVYRIGREEYIRDLSGKGARLFGGRWNKRGIPMIYTSEHRSLAALEVLVHTAVHQVPNDLMLLTLSIPDDLSTITLPADDLPEKWRTFPAPEHLVELGSNWAESQNSLLFRVPSAVVPQEWNILVNPRHEAIKQIKIADVKAFSFDGRLTEKG